MPAPGVWRGKDPTVPRRTLFWWRLWRDERAQDTLETMLVTGVVVVAMAVILLTGARALAPQVMGTACPSVDTGLPVGIPVQTSGACLTTAP